MSRAPKTRLPFPDLPADADPNLLARAHAEVSDWAEGKTREEIIARLIEVRADLLRARRDLRALARRLREIEERKAKRPAGGRGHTREDSERMAAARKKAEGLIRAWLSDRWARWDRDLEAWPVIPHAERMELFDAILASLPADLDVDDRTLAAWTDGVLRSTNYADLGMPGRLPPKRK
jgi:hypothetical protein